MLRSHQAEFSEICDQLVSGQRSERSAILSVTPGGGKSALPVIAGAKLIPAIADRVCWVVPRSTLQLQGQESFRDPLFRSLLDHQMFLGTAPGQGWGFVTTYQAIRHNARAYQRAFAEHRYILALDEPHHVAIGSEWCIDLQPLVDRCAFLMLMSGTLQRHDQRPIAFIPYREEAQGDQIFDLGHARRRGLATVEYTRAQALAEQAVIPLEVRWFDLALSWKEDGQQHDLFSLAVVDEEEEAKDGIHVALATGAAEQILLDCYQAWWEYRTTVTARSKLLVVAANVSSARRFKGRLEAAGAKRVGIAVSADGTEARRSIDRFKAHGPDSIDILCTVGIAYEGGDFPACTHIACLTNIRSPQWIEQMACRATRFDRAEGALPYEQQVAYLFCLDDMLMRRCIEAIIEQQEAFARTTQEREPGDADFDDGSGDGSAEESGFREFVIISSEHSFSGASDLEGDRLTADELRKLPLLARATGTAEHVLRSLRISQIRAQLKAYAPILDSADLQPVALPTTQVEAAADQRSLLELRRSINALANQVDAANGWQPGSANRMVRQRFGKSRTTMSAEELGQVERWLQNQFRSGVT